MATPRTGQLCSSLQLGKSTGCQWGLWVKRVLEMGVESVSDMGVESVSEKWGLKVYRKWDQKVYQSEVTRVPT